MRVLGINGFFNADHDGGSALVVDGELDAAVEEERLIRVKRAIRRRPLRSAAEVLSIASVEAQEVDVVAYPWIPTLVGRDPDLERDTIRTELRSNGIALKDNVRIEFISHHKAHAWSGLYYVPPDLRAECDIIVVDGSGENTAGARYSFRNDQLEALTTIPLESSLGYFYEGASTLAGFAWGEEGKLMGLASYADPRSISASHVAQLVGHLAREVPSSRSPIDSPSFDSIIRHWSAQLETLVGSRPRTFVERARVAGLAQAAFEARMVELVSECSAPTVVLAGGSALNCTSNGRLARLLDERGQTLVIPPCASDTGIALGAALAVASESGPIGHSNSALHGRTLTAEDARQGAAEAGARIFEVSTADIASRIADGQVLGWMSGRAEIGPRALGSRAIIATPSAPRIRDRVNLLKGRESWRPLAPSVSAEEFDRSFIGVKNRFMLQASQVADISASALAGVTHVDGTARPQVVPHEQADYLRVIDQVAKETNGPAAIVCTSFNAAGEPMVYSFHDGYRSARRMGLDAIVGDGWLVELPDG